MRESAAFEQARRFSYALLAQLFESGPKESALTENLPELREVLRLPEDERQAEHYRALGLELFPFRSVYLGERPDAPPSDHDELVEAARAQRMTDEVDHLATQLRLLSLADRSTVVSVLPRVVEWVPPFVVASGEIDSPLYAAATRAVWGLLVDHAHALEMQPDRAMPPPVDVEGWVADENKSMRDLASFLARPSACGVFLSRSAIRAWAASQEVPRGFGSRVTELENGFASAAQYDRGPESLDAMSTLFAERVAEYGRLTDEETTAPWVNPWRARADATHGLLSRLAGIADENR